MKSNINYKNTIFEQVNLTHINSEPTFKMLHKLRNEIKANSKAVYSNLGGGAHCPLGLVLTDVQYSLIYTPLFFYPTQPGPLIIPGGTSAHATSNMRIAHTKEVRLFREVTRVDQSLIQQIIGTVKAAYLEDIYNGTTNSINDIVTGVITQMQGKYGQLMLHKLL